MSLCRRKRFRNWGQNFYIFYNNYTFLKNQITINSDNDFSAFLHSSCNYRTNITRQGETLTMELVSAIIFLNNLLYLWFLCLKPRQYILSNYIFLLANKACPGFFSIFRFQRSYGKPMISVYKSLDLVKIFQNKALDCNLFWNTYMNSQLTGLLDTMWEWRRKNIQLPFFQAEWKQTS